ncbi:DNA-directed DNA polymerase [Synchytrium endobioticum]|uniref:DNA-directed DNA polymerase n=1 Tax=Synchytrium endobioticum TaxID=286115 RepID=A0A507DHI5_9FUNG|nr:DNA-directed DNA polymerase [Synchytrium endobioticum]
MLNDINLQRDADYDALEAMRKEAQANQGELGIQNRQLKQELASEKQNNSSLAAQVELFEQQKSQFHQWSVSRDKEVFAVRAELQATQQSLKEMDDRHEDLARDSEDLRAQNQHLQYQIHVLEESRDNNPGSREEENKLKSELEAYKSSITDLTGLVDQLQSDIVAERAEKQQSRAELKTALTQLDQEKGALLDMSCRMMERDSQLSNLHNESQAIKDEADGLRNEVASLKKLRTLNAKYSQDLNELKAKLHDQERLNAAANREIDALQEQIKSREEVLNRANAELTSFVQQHSSSSRTMYDAYVGQISDLQAENERLREDLADLRRGSAPDDHDREPTSTWIREPDNHLQGKLQVVADQLAEKTEECTHLLNLLDERSIAHREAVDELSERWGIEQAELKEDIALLKEERSHVIQDNELFRSQVEDLQRLYDESEFRRQEVDEKAQQELEIRQRELSAAHYEIKELEWKLEQAGQQLVLEQRAADAKISESNERIHALKVEMESLEKTIAKSHKGHSLQQGCLDRHNVPTSASSADDQRKVWKLNESLRQALDAKSNLVDETAQKLREAQAQLATTEHECNKYRRALRYREAAIRQATSKIFESNLKFVGFIPAGEAWSAEETAQAVFDHWDSYNGYKITVSEVKIPKSYKQAMKSVEATEWVNAVSEEVAALIANKTWELVDFPKNKHVLPGKWIYVTKHDEDGSILKHKSK